MKESMGYRSQYEKETKRKVPRDFTVHHISHDRSDGNILNLVALPAKLHVRYHQLYPQFIITHDLLQLPVNTDELVDMMAYAARLSEFIKIRQECLKWINYRNWLMGIEERRYKVGY